MLRKVKWHRQGVLQEVRGHGQADWLIENVTKWLVIVKGTLQKKAIKKMSSNEFLDSTQKIEQEWIDIGLTGK